MAINEKINFTIKTLSGETSTESATLNLKVPEYYNSTEVIRAIILFIELFKHSLQMNDKVIQVQKHVPK